jgi:hypothetical protein
MIFLSKAIRSDGDCISADVLVSPAEGDRVGGVRSVSSTRGSVLLLTPESRTRQSSSAYPSGVT